MNILIRYIAIMMAALCMAAGASAQDVARRGTQDEAVAMVKKASAYLQKNGKDKAAAAFNDPKGEFVAGDLYVIFLDQSGVALAHGQNQKIVNKNILAMTAGGVQPIKEFLKLANSPAGKGWFSYEWPYSISKKLEQKSTYVEKSGDYVIGVGIYK